MIVSRDPLSYSSIQNKRVNNIGIQYERNPEAEYGYHIKNTGCICNTSSSHTYGNVLSVIEKYIVDLFPQDLFKTITTSTTLASRQVVHLPHQLYKREDPMMVLIPRIMFGQDDNRFLANTIMNSRITNTQNTWGFGSLIPLAEDKNNNIYIHGHYNRDVLYVDVILSFNTYAEQVNYMSYIHNMIPVNHNQFIRAPLELYIPIEFCNLISKLSKNDIIKNGSVYNFMKYMNTIWNNPITYKLKGSTNSDEFFMYYLTDIDTVFQEPQQGQGIKDGQIRRHFEITFTVRCEFNTIGYFMLNSPGITGSMKITPKDNLTIVPIFSDVINLDDFQLPIGWSVLGWPIFRLKMNEKSISLLPIFNQSILTVIDHHLKFGIPMERFINIQFRENGQILDDEMFFINWNKRELVLLNPNYHRTYRLIITVSHEYINNLIKELYNLE